MSSLFEAAGMNDEAPRPLADRMRPTKIGEIVGQDHLVGETGVLTRMLRADRLGSVIFWGPPGTGKTTLARLLADESELYFEQLSAIFSGVKDLRVVFDAAKGRRTEGRGTLLFIDEIHRFNKSQQDSFLPHMEDGTIILVGATTENPSFELNAALLSRAGVLTFNRLDDAALGQLLDRAQSRQGITLPLDEAARDALIGMADGDGRALLNLADEVFHAGDELSGKPMDTKALSALVQRRAPVYDKGRDGHYNLISALHKSIRGSDPQAALYWLARILVAGEDPLFLARRLVRMASEEIALADPQALTQALAAKQAYQFLGSPEGELALAQATIYLATAPKSNAAYVAYKKVMADVKANGSLSPPKHILNAPTKLMKDEGYGKGYLYDHDQEHGFSGQDYFPDEMSRKTYYRPVERGFERDIQKRLEFWDRLRQTKAK